VLGEIVTCSPPPCGLFEALHRHLPAGTEEHHKHSQSGQRITRLRFTPITLRTRSRSDPAFCGKNVENISFEKLFLLQEINVVNLFSASPWSDLGLQVRNHDEFQTPFKKTHKSI
jgi:hypothetical protein